MSKPSEPSEASDVVSEKSLAEKTTAGALLVPPIRISPAESEDTDAAAHPKIERTSSRLSTKPPVAEATPVSPSDAAALKPGAQLDIEHLPVDDDPRLWSARKKNVVLTVISSAAFIATMASAIYFPASPSIQAEFSATNTQIALTASLFILFQGILPTFWASTSELIGRKKCYLASSVIFIGASLGCALAPSISSLIGLRILESAGASAVISIGAGTLTDMYETHERGRKVGIFYGAPLIGQSCAPIIGGALTSVANWRYAFYFCVAYGGLVLLLQIPLPEPFRQERSMAWRKAAKRAEVAMLQKQAKAEEKEKLSRPPSPPGDQTAAYPTPPASPKLTSAKLSDTSASTDLADDDLPIPSRAQPSRVVSIKDGKIQLDDGSSAKVKVTLRDINPLAALGAVVKKPNNVLLSTFTGLYYGLTYCLTYTGGFTYAQAPYNYDAFIVGCVLLAFGGGAVIGSVLGGRHSDFSYAKQKAANNNVGEPEMRIKTVWIPLAFLPLFLVGYAWAVDKGANVGLCATLLALIGLSGMWAYSSLLTYVVDANPGRASSAIAFNSFCRGAAAFVASQIASPLLSAEGHGWFYTAFAGVLAISELAPLAVQYRGKKWREGSSQQGRKITDARADVPSVSAGEPPRAR